MVKCGARRIEPDYGDSWFLVLVGIYTITHTATRINDYLGT